MPDFSKHTLVHTCEVTFVLVIKFANKIKIAKFSFVTIAAYKIGNNFQF